MRGSRLLLQPLSSPSHTLKIGTFAPSAFTRLQPCQTTRSVGDSQLWLRRIGTIPSPLQHENPTKHLRISTRPILRHYFSATPFRKEKAVAESHQSVQPEVQKNPEPINQVEEKVNETHETEDLDHEDEERGFGRSEKATQASQVNLSARLSKESKDAGKGLGLSETWRLVKIARRETKVLCGALILLLISSGVSITIPFSIGKFIDAATASELAKQQLYGYSLNTLYIALGSILFVGACANYGRILILRIVGERIVARLRSQLFRRTYVQNAEFFDANRTGDLISRLSSDTVIVGKSITQNLSDGLRSLVSGIGGMTMMVYTSVKLTSILLVCFPPVAIGTFIFGRMMRTLSRRIQKNLGTLTKIAEERLGNVRTSQSFAGEILEVSRYNNQVKKIFSLGKREAFLTASYFSGTSLMGNMTILAILYVGGGMVQSGSISVGELTSFLMYTLYAGSSLFGLSGFWSELMKGVGAASRLFELQDRKPTISPTVGLPVKSARGTIDFHSLSFAYPTRPAVTIFNDLDFSIPQGSNVAIVGPSGGGKSTIASLLLRFYTPTSGSIKIGGIDISDMNVKQLRRKIGVVSQEPVLFSGTIASNIAYAKPNATRAEIIAAARKANCKFIADFPDGLDTNVGPRGAQLSGGQKQRIAIARALVKNPDILILDEATSALDAESETLVNQALAALLRGNNTTISIAHRLSTIKRSDTIIVLSEEGKVAQMGSYDAISKEEGGAFMKLMEWQMSGSETETGTRNNAQMAQTPPVAQHEEHGDILNAMAEEGDEEVEHGKSGEDSATVEGDGSKK